MVPGSVVLVTGISAAGKSTVADLLARRVARGVHVRGDGFRKMILSGREDMAPDPPDEAVRQLRLRYELATTVADRYAAAGFTVVVQDIVFGPDLVEVVTRLAARPRFVVVLVPSPDVVSRREAGRAKTAYPPGGYTVEDLDAALRNDTPRIGLWLDSSHLDPEETVDEILRRADEARID